MHLRLTLWPFCTNCGWPDTCFIIRKHKVDKIMDVSHFNQIIIWIWGKWSRRKEKWYVENIYYIWFRKFQFLFTNILTCKLSRPENLCTWGKTSEFVSHSLISYRIQCSIAVLLKSRIFRICIISLLFQLWKI